MSFRFRCRSSFVRRELTNGLSQAFDFDVITIDTISRIWNDKPSTMTTVIGRIAMSLIIGSIYFG
jgi:hypothetical protein